MSLRWLPNALTVVRIALVPLIMAAIVLGQFANATWLFLAAGFSDALDGWLARRFGWRTATGAILDPIADKLLIVSTFLTLAWTAMVPRWLAVVVILRDLFIVAGGVFYQARYKDFEGAPSRSGKLSTLLLITTVLSVLIHASGWLPVSVLTMPWPGLGWLAALVTLLVISTIGYWREGMRRAAAKEAA
ncbi:MAG: CDP-alcohol phosphatidyltransferase family protein [Pseudomonadota bacterium]